MKRLIWIFFGLAILFLIPFLIWGRNFETAFTQAGAVAWLQERGSWAWAAGIGLLLADLILPVPGTAVMAALGFVYGPVVGGFIGAAGSFLAGSLGYVLCRMFGRAAAERLLGLEELKKGEQLFREVGGWLVAWSRWLPLLPEVIACMAGLSRMPIKAFAAAMVCGCLPLGFTFAFVGHAGVESPVLAVALSAILPPVLWLIVQRILWRKKPS